jgi:hypothetical protein
VVVVAVVVAVRVGPNRELDQPPILIRMNLI